MLGEERVGAAGGVHQPLDLTIGGGDRRDLGVRAVLVRPRIVVGQREQQEVEQVVLDQVGAHATGVLVADARHPELAAAPGLPARVQVGVEQLLGPVDRAPEQSRGHDPRERGLVGDLVVMAPAVDQISRPGGADVGVVEGFEHGVDVVGEVLGVHSVDGVGQRAQHAELPGGREARAVLDVAGLIAVIPVHARDQVPVGPDPGRDRRRANGRHRGKRRHAIVDVGALASDQLERGGPAGRDCAVEHLGLERVDHDEHELLGRWRGVHSFAGAATT